MLAFVLFLYGNFGISNVVLIRNHLNQNNFELLVSEKSKLDSDYLQKLLNPFQNQNCLVIIRNFLLIDF